MKIHWTQKEFNNAIIAQDDDCDYEESGWVAVVDGNEAALASYGHCSCYGTLTALGGADGLVFDWTGSVDDLIRLAEEKSDPHMPFLREANPKDCDYDHLMSVYDQILSWAAKRKELVTP